MTIREALLSGKPFKLPRWNRFQIPSQPSDILMVSSEDILSSDWCVEEVGVFVTESQVRNHWHLPFEDFLRKLGLKT